MRAKGATFQKLLLGVALLSALGWNLAQAGEVEGLRLSSGATGTRAEISLGESGRYNIISLSGPERLVVDLPESSFAKGFTLPGGAGVVQSVRTGQPVPGTARIVFDLKQAVTALKPRIEQGPDGSRLVLEWPGDGDASASTSVATAPAGPAAVDVASASATQTRSDQTAASSAARILPAAPALRRSAAR